MYPIFPVIKIFIFVLLGVPVFSGHPTSIYWLVEPALQGSSHLQGDGGRRGESRRFDADKIDEPRQVFADDEIPKPLTRTLEFRSDARHVGNNVLPENEREKLDRPFIEAITFRRINPVILNPIDVCRVRAQLHPSLEIEGHMHT